MDTFPQNFGGEQLLLQLGNGAAPEVFTSICTINMKRTFKFTSATSTTELADCSNPANPSQVARIVKSLDFNFTGDGVCDGQSYFQMVQWQQTGQQKNCKLVVNRTGAQGGMTVSGPFVITSIDMSGATHESVTFTCTIEQAQPVTVTQNA